MSAILEVGPLVFDAAHFLPSYKGVCRRLHGHTYAVTVRVRGEIRGSMVMDARALRELVKKVITEYDHKLLVRQDMGTAIREALRGVGVEVEIVELPEDPTVEVLAKDIANKLAQQLPPHLSLEVCVREGFGAAATIVARL